MTSPTPNPQRRECSDCAKTLHRRNVSGKCLTCFNRARTIHHPKTCTSCGKPVSARQNKVGLCRTCCIRDGAERARKDPEKWARIKAACAASGTRNFNDPAVRRRQMESRARNTAKRWEERARGLPPEYQQRARKIARHSTVEIGLAIARMEYKRRLAEMTPFERQMEAVRNGAGLVEKPPVPGKSYDYTLGGVTAL